MSDLFVDSETNEAANTLVQLRQTPQELTPQEQLQKRVSQMKAVQQEGLLLFAKKNADYGDAFASHGIPGVLMRMGDKLLRFQKISKTGVQLVNDEKLRDTLIDLHNYAAMAILLLDEEDSDLDDDQEEEQPCDICGLTHIKN